MSRRAFHDLIQKYLDGNCTEEERIIVDKWYQLLDHENNNPVDNQQLKLIEERLWEKVVNKTSLPNKKTQKPAVIWRKLAIAATIAGLLSFSVYILFTDNVDSTLQISSTDALIDTKNNTDRPLDVSFSDGSTATLQPGAAVSYLTNFEKNKREVFLKGEVYFNVEKDSNRPFFVISNDLVTKVVGTSFIVKSNEATKVSEVVVLTGKVLVAENGEIKNYQKNDLFSDEKNNIVLTPNQRIVFKKTEKEMVRTLAESPLPLPLDDSESQNTKIHFVYKETAISSVFEGLESSYGIEIIPLNKTINTCTFTGDLNEPNLYTNLDFVCQSIGASYEIKETKIFIIGGNCN